MPLQQTGLFLSYFPQLPELLLQFSAWQFHTQLCYSWARQ